MMVTPKKGGSAHKQAKQLGTVFFAVELQGEVPCMVAGKMELHVYNYTVAEQGTEQNATTLVCESL